MPLERKFPLTDPEVSEGTFYVGNLESYTTLGGGRENRLLLLWEHSWKIIEFEKGVERFVSVSVTLVDFLKKAVSRMKSIWDFHIRFSDSYYNLKQLRTIGLRHSQFWSTSFFSTHIPTLNFSTHTNCWNLPPLKSFMMSAPISITTSSFRLFPANIHSNVMALAWTVLLLDRTCVKICCKKCALNNSEVSNESEFTRGFRTVRKKSGLKIKMSVSDNDRETI